MGGIGVSLDVEDDGGGGLVESRSKDDVLSFGVPDDLNRSADEGFLDFGLSAGDEGFECETGEGRGEIKGEVTGDCERGGFSGISGGVNVSSFDPNESWDFEREGCKPLNPLARADSLSPSPREDLRGRTVDESVWAASWDGSLDGSDVRGGRTEFSPTSCPMSISGFAGRRAGDPEARDIALLGR